jgi:hypothetical protein
MDRSVAVAGSVLWRSSDVIDPRLRMCSEHLLHAAESNKIIAAMQAVVAETSAPPLRLPPILDGPKFWDWHVTGSSELGMVRAFSVATLT